MVYNHKKLIVLWINKELIFIQSISNNKGLFVIDVVSFSKIKNIFNAFNKYSIN